MFVSFEIINHLYHFPMVSDHSCMYANHLDFLSRFEKRESVGPRWRCVLSEIPIAFGGMYPWVGRRNISNCLASCATRLNWTSERGEGRSAQRGKVATTGDYCPPLPNAHFLLSCWRDATAVAAHQRIRSFPFQLPPASHSVSLGRQGRQNVRPKNKNSFVSSSPLPPVHRPSDIERKQQEES